MFPYSDWFEWVPCANGHMLFWSGNCSDAVPLEGLRCECGKTEVKYNGYNSCGIPTWALVPIEVEHGKAGTYDTLGKV